MAQNDWVIGVVFSVLSSLLSCLGLIFQKKAHMQNQALPEGKKWPVVAGIVCSPCWWASFALMGLIPFPFDFFAYSFAAQSLIAPFAAVTLIMNQFFAPLILKEKLYRSDVYASVIVFTGTMITTLSGNHEAKSYDLNTLLPLFRAPSFIVCGILLFTIVALMMYSLHLNKHLGPDGKPIPEEDAKEEDHVEQEDHVDNLSATDSTVVIEMNHGYEEREEEEEQEEQVEEKNDKENPPSQEQATEESTIKPKEDSNKIALLKKRAQELNITARPLYYGFIAGAFGGMQNVFFKGVGVLMKSSVFDGQESSWVTPYPYVFLLVVIVLALGQLSFLNKGMSRFDAVLVFPLYNACYIFLSVSLGALFYGEFKNFDATQWALYPLGVTITLFGILILIQKTRESDDEQVSESDGKDEVRKSRGRTSSTLGSMALEEKTRAAVV